MSAEVKGIFERKVIQLPLERLMPTREVKSTDSAFGKYKAILASIPIMGLIEPLAVHPCRGKAGYYVLLDGHMRLKALRELGEREANCMIATEDDSFTYNDKISRINAIGEHRMIMKTIAQGVSAEDVARTLAVNVERIKASMDMLRGIHPDAVERLKDKPITPGALRLFRKVKAFRQLEFADLMAAMGDYTVAYAKALLLATPPDMLEDPATPKIKQLKPEEIAQMEKEMEMLERDFRVYQDRYGENALSLNVVQRFVQRLLENVAVKRYLNKRFPEILEELTVVAQMETL
ncbi:MAG: ParB-like nuclease [Verrucomicrobia bacterium]|nr:ParB-like nuclease [Verrucomicrobiota bacterium]